MNELDRAASRGMRALFGRQAFVQIVTFVAGIALARLLDPAQFGLFYIASFLVTAVATVGDFGFGPSLIQRRANLVDRDLWAAFTLQIAATTVLAAALLAFAPPLASLYPKAPPETAWLVRVLAINLFLTTWRSISFLQLERDLRFRRVALIESVEAISFQVVAVAAAVAGAGVWSLVAAAAVSGTAGTSLAYVSAPWRVGFAVDRSRFGELLRFGVPYQAQMLLNSVGGWAWLVALGGLFGPRGVGLITWASANGRKPLAYFDNVTRVAFPHLSRQQDDPAAVRRTMTRYLGYLTAPAALWTVCIAVGAHGVVEIVYGTRWAPAVPALTLFGAALPFDTACILFVVVLNSAGSPTFVARTVLLRSLLLGGLAAALGLAIGVTGFALAYLMASVFTTILLARRIPGAGAATLRLRWLMPAISTALAAGFAVRLTLPDPEASIAAVGAATTTYGCVGWWRAPPTLRRRASDTVHRLRIGRGELLRRLRHRRDERRVVLHPGGDAR